MANHTPGPWRLNRAIGSVHGPDGTAIKTVGVGYAGDCAEEYIANALLISAAPELLEACELASRSVPHHPDSKLVLTLSAAIRKATQAHPQETQP